MSPKIDGSNRRGRTIRMKKIKQCRAFVYIRSVQDESKRRVSHSMAPSSFCMNMWIETTGRADFKLILETVVKLLVIQYLMRR